jgi:tetratricopeptide (TPR) repeat protein/predicted nucleotidyltransferase
MRLQRKGARAVFAAACLVPALLYASSSLTPPRASAQSAAAAAREEAYRANNLGVALLEQFKPKEAAEEFRRALRLDPRMALARTNLAIALFNVPDVDASKVEAEAAASASPDAPQPHYILGLIAKQQGRVEDALASFRRVLSADARDVGANVQVGQLLAQQRKYAEAAAAFRVALEEEPYNGTALYSLGTALLRSGAREEGNATMQRFQELRASGASTAVGQNYLEQGRYAEALPSTGAEPDLVDRRTPAVSYTDASAQAFTPAGYRQPAEAPSREALKGRAARPAGAVFSDHEAVMREHLVASLGGGMTLFDYDGDGDLDLSAYEGAGWRLYRNDGGKFADVTAQSGALSKAAGLSAVAGDFDNDERPDLFVFGAGSCALYRNEGGGRFADATAAAKVPSYPHLSRSAAFVDYDHDGDLDLFVAGLADASKLKDAGATTALGPELMKVLRGPGGSGKIKGVFDLVRGLPGAPNLLLRNNGDGTFADVTGQAKVSGGGHAAAVVPTDYDNRRDVDLLVVNYGAPPALYRNLRDGTFREVAAEVGLGAKGDYTSAAAGDFNKDGFTDFYLAAADAPGLFAASDGRGRFKTSPARASVRGSAAAQFIDYDADGLLDLVAASAAGPRVLRNVGGAWADVSAAAAGRLGRARVTPRALLSADLDGDGDTDIVGREAGGALRLLRNDGGSRNASLRVRLSGKVSNRGGVAAKVELRAGSLRQKLETHAATPAPAPSDVLFGLGGRRTADAVRVIWPSGVVQAEAELPAARQGSAALALKVEELDRKPSSCPYLYTWNGTRFEFVTDFMGGGEMGAWAGPGRYNTPDPDEYVRIRGDQLKERDGRYELRVTNELEEVLFFDRLQLLAVSHPAGVEVFPNEGLGNPTGPGFRLYASRGARPPLSARDEHGHDVLARLAKLDRTYPDDFKLLPVRGYAAEHALTLDLGRDASLLLLTGWTDYAWSSDNLAASQRGLEMRPPSLQVRDGAGRWRTVVESMGFPVGRPQTVTVDLKGKFLSESREVRIVTNMRVYWDQALVDSSGGGHPSRVEPLEAAGATLRERGFSAEVTPDGREPYTYDYARVSLASPWKAFTGRYTRLGDVRELLAATDDMFVVSKPGDELALSFDAGQLKPLPAGWTRTFLLYADGFSKEMDINSASPHEVAPLPFHGMKRYPYAAPESYPRTKAHLDYLERYNTRVVAAPLPGLLPSGR